MAHANEQLLATMYAAFTKGDVPTVLSLLSDDVEFHIIGGGPVSGDYAGKDEVLGFFGKLMGLSGGTFQLEILDILANDHCGVTLTMERAERVGKKLENRAVHVWEIRDGKGVRFRGYNEEVWDQFWS